MKHDVWGSGFQDAAEVVAQFAGTPENLERCRRFGEMLTRTFQDGGNVFSCGNGGSHCDAMHFAEELTGRYRKARRALGALALGDASHVTCTSNDYGFDEVFARQLSGLGRRGDLLIAFSTSGNSPNILRALAVAKEKGITSVALLGRDGGKARGLADHAIVVPGQTSDRIQEMHIKIVHLVIEQMERNLFPENYA